MMRGRGRGVSRRCGCLQVWDFETGEFERTFKGFVRRTPSQRVFCAAVAQSSSLGAAPRAVWRWWSCPSMQPSMRSHRLCTIACRPCSRNRHTNVVNHIAFNAAGTLLASCSADLSIKVPPRPSSANESARATTTTLLPIAIPCPHAPLATTHTLFGGNSLPCPHGCVRRQLWDMGKNRLTKTLMGSWRGAPPAPLPALKHDVSVFRSAV